MENEKIIQTLKSLFAGADERDWNKVQSAMAASVKLDYTSLADGTPMVQTPEQITNTWAMFLPGFDKTNHQLSGFEVTTFENVANVHYHGRANHFIDNEVWTVEGTYDSELRKESSRWLVTKLRFNLTKQSGNTNLPSTAVKRMQTKIQ